MNTHEFLPENGSSHHYKSSLTKPLCSEGVNWFAFAKPVPIDAEQTREFTHVVGENARAAQSSHDLLPISKK